MLKKFVPYVVALSLFASGCASLQPKTSGKNPYNEGWENAYRAHQNLKYEGGDNYWDNYENTFRAAKNCDIESYKKFKQKALEREVAISVPDCAELEVKSALLFCSRELEWMFKDRTPEEKNLIQYGIKEVRDYRNGWPLKNDVLLCEFLAKDKPKEALKIADKIIAEGSIAAPEFIERIMLDKAFILIKTKKGYKTASKLYDEVIKTHESNPYISEMLDVLKEYLPEKQERGKK